MRRRCHIILWHDSTSSLNASSRFLNRLIYWLRHEKTFQHLWPIKMSSRCIDLSRKKTVLTCAVSEVYASMEMLYTEVTEFVIQRDVVATRHL